VYVLEGELVLITDTARRLSVPELRGFKPESTTPITCRIEATGTRWLSRWRAQARGR